MDHKFSTLTVSQRVQALLMGFKGRFGMRPKDTLPSGRLEKLLEGYRTYKKVKTQQDNKTLERLRPFFVGFSDKLKDWENDQRATAERFNLLEVLRVDRKELLHSKVLAWLLDHRMSKHGTHAQGKLGFCLFLNILGKELGLIEAYSETQYRVSLEPAGDGLRADIEVAAPGRFVIHFENKVDSEEGEDQTKNEWEALLKRAEELGIPHSCPPARVHGIFLTLQGEPPHCEHFKPMSWAKMARVFEEFGRQAQPPDVRLFASHYAKALRNLSPGTSEEERRTDYGEPSVQ